MSWFSQQFANLNAIFNRIIGNRNLQQSLVDAIGSIVALARQHKNNPAILDLLLSEIDANKEKIIAAAVVGTPAEAMVDPAVVSSVKANPPTA